MSFNQPSASAITRDGERVRAAWGPGIFLLDPRKLNR